MAICLALSLPYPRQLQSHCYSDWTSYRGYHTSPDSEGSIGIWALSLSHYAIEALGLMEEHCMGRGFQAQANARAIRDHFHGKKKVED